MCSIDEPEICVEEEAPVRGSQLGEVGGQSGVGTLRKVTAHRVP